VFLVVRFFPHAKSQKSSLLEQHPLEEQGKPAASTGAGSAILQTRPQDDQRLPQPLSREGHRSEEGPVKRSKSSPTNDLTSAQGSSGKEDEEETLDNGPSSSHPGAWFREWHVSEFCDHFLSTGFECPDPHGASDEFEAKKRTTSYHKAGWWEDAEDHWAVIDQWIGEGDRKHHITFHINTHDPETEDPEMSALAHRNKVWDKHVWNVFHEKLFLDSPPRSLVVDCGANIGTFSLWAVAMGHDVVAFEPMDFNVRYLLSSIRRNRWDSHVTVYQNAVGTGHSFVRLAVAEAGNLANFGVRGAATSEGDYGTDHVRMVRMDEVLHSDVLLMKIDVEGFESFALMGAAALMCNHVVKNVVFDCTEVKKSAECPIDRTACWLSLLGYRISGATHHDQDLDPAAAPKFPSKILLRLRYPLLPPALVWELNGGDNPCKQYMIGGIEDESWRTHKRGWCKHHQDAKERGQELPQWESQAWTFLQCDDILMQA
jgi:FkbM family methyltransferase